MPSLNETGEIVMNQLKKPLLLAMGLAALTCAPVLVAQPYAYVPNYSGNSVTVIDTATNGWITGMVNGLQSLSVAGNDATRIVPAAGTGS